MSTLPANLPQLSELSEHGQNYLALKDASTLIEAQQVNDEAFGLSSLVRVKTPSGGATTWEIDDGLGNTDAADEVVGALVLYAKRAVLWPTDGDAIEGTKPVLVSYDLRTAHRVGDDLGDIDEEILEAARIDGSDRYDITEQSGFAYAQWGSGRNGGKRLKEQRVLGILRPGDLWPMLFTVQPGSLKNITLVVSRFTLPHYRYVAELRLEAAKNQAGQKYSQMHMRIVGQLSPAEGEFLNKLYREPLLAALQAGRIDPDADQ